MRGISVRAEAILVRPETSLRETIRVIDAGVLEIALVTNSEGRLLGTVTDGDVRRALIRGVVMDDPVSRVMNPDFTSVPAGTPLREIAELIRGRYLKQIPVLDTHGRVVDIVHIKDIIREAGKDNPVVIMAGGLGTRLRPLTNEVPKPMLHVGEKPLLQTIIEKLASHGYRDILLSVNYKADVIENYFQDGRHFGVRVQYLRENRRLGTAGALRLARPYLRRPAIVLNGDILTSVNFDSLLQFHTDNRFDITMCTKRYDVPIPYGVVNLTDVQVTAITEKPTLEFFIAAGIYCLNPEVVDLIPADRPCDMPDLARAAIGRGMKVGSFPIREYWLDIGHLDDYQRAQADIAAGLEETQGSS